MRRWRCTVPFTKMQGCGDDYIFIENFDGSLSCPESLCVGLCSPHTGIGGDGIVLIGRSSVADAKMRIFNKDGSEGKMAGNSIRCVGKYLYDKGYVQSEYMTIESASGLHRLRLYLRDGKVSSAEADMGKVSLDPKDLPAKLPGVSSFVDLPLPVGGKLWRVTGVSLGNPHAVVFEDALDALELSKLGPAFEHDPLFPDRINAEFVRVLGKAELRVRVWERGNGETMACGTGACAAVVAAVENGYCERGRDVTVHLPGGDLTVNYADGHVTLTGNAVMVYEGIFEI